MASVVTWWRRSCAGRALAGCGGLSACAPPDPRTPRTAHLVERDLSTAGPTQLWVMDLTDVPTRQAVVSVYLITDAFSSMIVGWRVAAHLHTERVLDALEMARGHRGTNLEGLVVHSDAGSPMTSIR